VVSAAATPGMHNSIPVSELSMAMDLTSRAPVTLVDVWDDKYVERRGENVGKTEQWYCKWCDYEFKQWNATKCLAHVSRIRGHDIKVCNGAILDGYMELYIDLMKQKNARNLKNKWSCDSIMETVVALQNTTADYLQASKKRGKYERQGTTPGMFDASVYTKLDMAVADFIHGHALSFRLTENARFQGIIEVARYAGKYLVSHVAQLIVICTNLFIISF
jgi:hypothetical protein